MSTRSSRSPSGPPRALIWIWSTVQSVVIGGVLLTGFAMFVPLDDIERASIVPEGRSGAASTRNGIRTISLSADRKEAWVARFPAVMQRIRLADGALLSEQEFGETFLASLQPCAALGESVVYRTGDATYLHCARPWGTPVKLTNEYHEWIAASPMHDLLAVCANEVIEIWSMDTGIKQHSRMFGCSVARLDWSPDGERLLIMLKDGRLELLETETLATLQTQTTWEGCANLVWAANGRHVAAYSPSHGIDLWDMSQDHLQRIGQIPGYLYTCALSPDGACVAIPGENGQILLIDTAASAQRTILGTAPSRINALCFSPDGSSLLVGSIDGRLDCWSLARQSKQWSLDMEIDAPAISNDMPPNEPPFYRQKPQTLSWQPATQRGAS